MQLTVPMFSEASWQTRQKQASTQSPSLTSQSSHSLTSDVVSIKNPVVRFGNVYRGNGSEPTEAQLQAAKNHSGSSSVGYFGQLMGHVFQYFITTGSDEMSRQDIADLEAQNALTESGSQVNTAQSMYDHLISRAQPLPNT